MPKIPNTLVRNGTYYFYARNRTDLVKAGLLKPHEKRILKTKDYRTAEERAARETVAHNMELDRVEREHLKLTSDEVIQDKPALSAREQRDWVLEYFVELERKHEALSIAYAEKRDSVERDEMRQSILDDAVA